MYLCRINFGWVFCLNVFDLQVCQVKDVQEAKGRLVGPVTQVQQGDPVIQEPRDLLAHQDTVIRTRV